MNKKWNNLSENLPDVGKKIIMMLNPVSKDEGNSNVLLKVVSRKDSSHLEFDDFATAKIKNNEVDNYIVKNIHMIEKMHSSTSHFDFLEFTEHAFWMNI